MNINEGIFPDWLFVVLIGATTVWAILSIRLSIKKALKGTDIRNADPPLLRSVHAIWITWLFVFLFTITASPYIFFVYRIPLYPIAFFIVVLYLFSLLFGYFLGMKIANFYQKCIPKPEKRIQSFYCLFAGSIFMALVMWLDILTITEEIGFTIASIQINQYDIYTLNLFLLLLATVILTFPLIKAKCL